MKKRNKLVDHSTENLSGIREAVSPSERHFADTRIFLAIWATPGLNIKEIALVASTSNTKANASLAKLVGWGLVVRVWFRGWMLFPAFDLHEYTQWLGGESL